MSRNKEDNKTYRVNVGDGAAIW